MKAIIFAAGLGTRLQPLTNNTPKALVKLNGQPLLFHAINKLIDAGVTRVVVNVHHFGEQIINYLQNNNFKIPISISDERDMLLETGGALLKAAPLLEGNDPVVAMNVDIISSIDIAQMVNHHMKSNSLATLAVRQRQTSRYLLFNPKMQLCGWENIASCEKIITRETTAKLTPLAFSGIQVLSPLFFDMLTETGKFSVIKSYLRLAHEHNITGYHDHSSFWIDVGKPGELEKAAKLLEKTEQQ
jgi:NDP-sugar pyrophosphorylase family protein